MWSGPRLEEPPLHAGNERQTAPQRTPEMPTATQTRMTDAGPQTPASAAEAQAYASVLRNLTAKINDFNSRVKVVRSLPHSGGISLLDVHIHSFLEYVQGLVAMLHARLHARRLGTEEQEPLVNSLIEARVVLERIKPLEQKLNYQIDKLLKVAAATVAGEIDEHNRTHGLTAGEGPGGDDDEEELLAHRPNPGQMFGNAGAANNNDDDNDNEDSEGESSGSESDTQAAYNPAAQKAKKQFKDDMDKLKKSNRQGNSRRRSDMDSENNGGVYLPPRVAPQKFQEESVRQRKLSERARKTALGSRILKEVSDEIGYKPEEISSTGAAYAGKFTQQASVDDRKHAEREQYEEANFVRLPNSREDTRRTKRIKSRGLSSKFDDEFANIGKEFELLNDVSKIVKSNQKPVTILDRKNANQSGITGKKRRNLDSTLSNYAKNNTVGETSSEQFGKDVRRAKRAKALRTRVRAKQQARESK